MQNKAVKEEQRNRSYIENKQQNSKCNPNYVNDIIKCKWIKQLNQNPRLSDWIKNKVQLFAVQTL